MSYVVLDSMTYLEEGEIRHVLGLPDLTSKMLGVEASFNDSWVH